MLAMSLWIARELGQVTSTSAGPPMLWHAHEMLFGFAVAVIVGFLLTAGKSWTRFATPRGPLLDALALLWATARVAAMVGPYPIYALLDLMLLPLVAAVLVHSPVRDRDRRNLLLVGFLVLLSLVNVAFHLAANGTIPMAPLTTLHVGLALIVVIDCVVAGRVILPVPIRYHTRILRLRPTWLRQPPRS